MLMLTVQKKVWDYLYLNYAGWAATVPYLVVIIAELRCLIMFAPEC